MSIVPGLVLYLKRLCPLLAVRKCDELLEGLLLQFQYALALIHGHHHTAGQHGPLLHLLLGCVVFACARVCAR